MAPHAPGRFATPALIEGTIPQLYTNWHLSARQIARLTEVSRSKALTALRRCGIPLDGRNRTHPGQLPFGYDYQNYRLVKNQAEQGVIRLMGRARAGGLSLRQIAGQLNQRLVASKGGETLAGQHHAPDPVQELNGSDLRHFLSDEC